MMNLLEEAHRKRDASAEAWFSPGFSAVEWMVAAGYAWRRAALSRRQYSRFIASSAFWACANYRNTYATRITPGKASA
jgi:hypothetical protein